jgi:hypothetical protein
MCCLKYEQDAYEDLIRNSPKLESFVDTPEGRGTVVEINLLRQRVKVRMENQPEVLGNFANDEIAVLRSGKAKKTDAPIPDDLAPISGAGKRQQKQENGGRMFLDPIKFRYSEETVVEEPEKVEEPAEPKQEQKQNHRNRHKNRKPKNPDAPKQEQKPKAEPAPVQQENGEQAGEGAKKRRRHHHRRKPKASGENKQG